MFFRAKASSAVPDSSLRLRPRVKDVVFVHISKTAGTSMRNMLVAALPEAVKIFDYGANTDQIQGDFINAFTNDGRTPKGVLALRRRFERDQRLLVSGHMPARWYLNVFHPASFITFLRLPVDRLVSAYKHHCRYINYRGSFAEFCELPSQINLQSRVLRGMPLRAMGFVGLTELMPDMLSALSRHLDVEIKNRKDNVGSRFGGTKVNDAIRARIVELNQDDLQLYRDVEANLDYFTNCRGRGADKASTEGKVNYRGDGLLQGWATALPANRLVELEFKVGEQVIHHCYADQFVPALRSRAAHGVGGFSLRLPADLAATKPQVRVVFAGTERDLDGSPVTV